MDVLARLRERFWFLPAVLCLAAFLLAELLIAVDEQLGQLSPPAWLTVLLYRVGESGSRDILGAIATSSLAVAGTTFSITMAVLALTSSTYGPRLVRNFMVDRGNQLVLGVFVATFLYSLLVLRSIRVLGDPGDQQQQVFVPHLAVNGAVLLAVANVAVLVYFIHHISDSIQVWSLAGAVRADLRETVARLYPGGFGQAAGAAEPGEVAPPPPSAGAPVTAGRSGYIQHVDGAALLRAARRHDVLLALQVRPGRYVIDDTPVARVHPPEAASERLQHAVRAAVGVGQARSPRQDVEFAVQQLTELAVRALSPGTNDPYTALNALDDLSSGLAMIVGRRPPSSARYDQEGRLRVHAPAVSAAGLVRGVLAAVRWYGGAHPLVLHRALDLVATVGEHARDPALRAELPREVGRLVDALRATDPLEDDLADLVAHADDVRRGLARR